VKTVFGGEWAAPGANRRPADLETNTACHYWQIRPTAPKQLQRFSATELAAIVPWPTGYPHKTRTITSRAGTAEDLGERRESSRLVIPAGVRKMRILGWKCEANSRRQDSLSTAAFIPAWTSPLDSSLSVARRRRALLLRLGDRLGWQYDRQKRQQ
jgi:hypothetical protein